MPSDHLPADGQACAHPDWLQPEGLPPGIGAVMSTRAGGVSQGPWAGLNLRPPELPGTGLDVAADVRRNQARFVSALQGARPVWLDQVHGREVVVVRRTEDVDAAQGQRADACVTDQPGVACLALVADCLPVLLWTADGRVVGAAHAGWRGLAGGVLEATVEALRQLAGHPGAEVQGWLGACIGPQAFEVGEDVREAFAAAPAACFAPGRQPGKWWADLPALARWRLAGVGVVGLGGGQWCTLSHPSRFFSFRRDRVTGRQAAAIWRRA
ncbi:peptidoglycan editing factor PgeF [Ideonella livida]|uniref:Purine nucleoside phosphorylase n=1 Tax=Ideonella livida TaxID=2707176 RepID=A0A7C9PHM6_9BURK|nr:peptidoglycan editing factor PgeF [Ideonella livida]NDY92213.1 peptidoglycan editing factor PgeF [Ideonella livida]